MDKTESGLRSLVGSWLRLGVWASACFLVMGLIRTTKGESTGLPWITTGLFILALTPVIRVALLAAGYASNKDWKFFGAALGVLFLLIAGALSSWVVN